MDTDQSSTFLSSIQSEIAKYQLLIEEENQKLKRYKVGFSFSSVFSIAVLYFLRHTLPLNVLQSEWFVHFLLTPTLI